LKTYPHIPHKIPSGTYYFFAKLDGSNTRAEWTHKRGFDKFGKRNALLDSQTPFLEEAKGLILNKYGDELSRIFRRARYDKATAFFEFWGENSFAGVHEDEPHTVTLFDIAPHKKGILPPRDYLDLVGDIDIAEMVYYGNVNQDIIRQVKEGNLPGQSFEGVVAKAKHPGKQLLPVMFKLKSNAWLDRLRERCRSLTVNDEAADSLFEKLR